LAYRFAPGEGWQPRSAGEAGDTQWAAPKWSLDFTQGTAWLAISPPDRSLLGNIDKIHLRVRGSAKGHPVHLFLRTHFMTFHKVVGEFSDEGEQEIAVDGPPGPGWQWFAGENDGKVHDGHPVAEPLGLFRVMRRQQDRASGASPATGSIDMAHRGSENGCHNVRRAHHV
jgi:hypothetical protein